MNLPLILSYLIYYTIIYVFGINSIVWGYIVIITNSLLNAQNARYNLSKITFYSNLLDFLEVETMEVAKIERKLEILIF